MQMGLALVLVVIFSISVGYQYTGSNHISPSTMDICDHFDGEPECDKQEEGKSDEFYKQEQRRILKMDISAPIKGALAQLDYPLYPPENPTPPPEQDV